MEETAVAVVLLVVVAVLAVVALPVALARRRPPAPTGATTLWTAHRPPSWAGQSRSPDAAPTAEDAVPPTPPGTCDWELHLATGEGVVVLRRARQRPCCIHTLALTWLDDPPGTHREQRGLAWSGEHTWSDPAGATSRTWQATTTDRIVARGPGLSASTTVVGEPGPEVHTPWVAAADVSPTRPRGDERLWAAHLRTLRRHGARPRPDDQALVSTVDVVDRLRVRVDVTRGCATGTHQLAARARTGAEVTGTARGARHARCRLPAVAAWVSGDLRVAATTPSSTSPATTVRPLGESVVTPVPTAAPVAVAVDGDPTRQDVTASLVGDTDTRVQDGEFDAMLGGMALLELSLGPTEHRSAQARLDVVLHHHLAVVVRPTGPADDDCACRPRWELHLGDALLPEPSVSPLGRLVVDDRELTLHRADDTGPPGALWAVPRTP